MEGDGKHLRKPRGRFRKPCNNLPCPERKGALVEFWVKKKEQYFVDVSAMYQKNLSSGHRREVSRRDGVWFYDSAAITSNKHDGGSTNASASAKWAIYETPLQQLLEDAYRECHPEDAAASQPTVPQPTPLQGAYEDDFATRLEKAPEGTLGQEELLAAMEVVRSQSLPLALALRALTALTRRHSYRCVEEDVRHLALRVRSVAALQIAMQSNPDLTLLGVDVFDRRMAGLPLDDTGLKSCLKALLARGARLGRPSVVPGSKLLKKYDSDAFPLWAQRYFLSMALAGMELPEHLQAKVEAFF